MKKLLYILLALFSITAITSCKDDEPGKTDVVSPSEDPTKDPSVDSTKREFNITFRVDEEIYHSAKCKEGEVFDVSLIRNPKKDGYTFTGWDYDFKNAITNDVVCNATFEANAYKINYTIDGSEIVVNVGYGKEYTLAKPEKENYEFLGFYLDDTLFPLTGTFDRTSDITLEARFNKLANDIIYHLDEGFINADGNPLLVKKGEEAITLLPLAREGYRFDGWYSDPNLTAKVESLSFIEGGEDINLYPKMHRYSTITYNLDGGTNNADNPAYITDGKVVLGAPTKDGAVFRGWYSDSEFTTLVKEIPADSGDVTLYARFDSRLYKVNIEGFDNVLEALYGGTVTLPKLLKPGYTFKHYLLNDEVCADTIEFTFDDDITLTPVFEANTYKISYTFNDATTVLEVKFDSTYELPALEKENFKFLGYYLGDTLFPLTGTYKEARDITLEVRFNNLFNRVDYHLPEGIKNNPLNPDSIKKDEEKALAPLKIEGYRFDGWFSDENLTTKVENIAFVQGEEVINVYPKLHKYSTITYVLDGGVNNEDNPAFIALEKVTLLPATKDRYVFLGWFTDADLTIAITEIPADSADITLYAKFEMKSYKVNVLGFDKVFEVVYNGTVELAPVIKPGYTFKHYLYNGVEYTSTLKFTFDDDITLTPVFEANKYKITYTIDGVKTELEVTFDKEYKLIAPVKEDCKFLGFYLDEVLFPLEGMYTKPCDITLEARFNNLFNHINYHMPEGVENNPKNPTTVKKGQELPLLGATREGFRFDGWYSDSSFTTKVESVTFVDGGKDIDLYLKLTAYNKVTYELNGGENNPDNLVYIMGTAITLKDATKEGAAFRGWYTDSEFRTPITEIPADSESITVYARFDSRKYKITFDGYDNVVLTLYNGIVTLPTLEKLGHTNTGFTLGDKSFTHEFTFTYDDDITLVPVFTPNEYNLTIDYNTGHASNPTTFTFGETIELEPAVRNGYTFVAYHVGKPDGEVFDGVFDMANDLKLYTEYKINEYTITYNLEGGAFSSEVKTTFTIKDSFNLPSPKKPGYDFKGWYDASNTRIYEVENTYESLNLKAKWVEHTYTITLFMFSDSKSLTCDYLKTMAIENPKEYRGYTFDGWYLNGEKLTDFTYTYTKDINLVANFTPVQYKITYELDGGTNHPDNPDTYTILSDDIYLKPAAKPGYFFDGWSSEKIEHNSSVDKVIKAKFKPLSFKITVYYSNGDAKLIYYKNGDPITKADFAQSGYEPVSVKVDGVDFVDNNLLLTDEAVAVVEDKAIEYQLTLNLNGGTLLDTRTTINVENAYEVIKAIKGDEGYATWYLDEALRKEFSPDVFKGNPSDIELFAKYSRDLYYTIVPNIDEVKIYDSGSISKGDTINLPNTEVEGYNFLGYFVDGVKFTATVYNFNEPKVFEARYEAIEYKITYDAGEGTGPATNPLTYTKNCGIALNPSQAPDYTRFVGWYNGNEKVQVLVDVTGDLNLVAKYENIKYTIEYLNTPSSNQNPTIYTKEGLTLEPIKDTGRVFVGFYLEGTDTKVEVLDASYGDVVLECRFVLGVYNVTIDLGNGEAKAYELKYNDRIPSEGLDKRGYDFQGFMCDGKLTSYLTVDKDVTVTPVYKIFVYDITYKGVTEEELALLPKTYTVLDEVLFPRIEREGFRFDGWYEWGRNITCISKGSTYDKEIELRFVKPAYTLTIVTDNGEEDKVITIYDEELYLLTVEKPYKENYKFTGWSCEGCEYDSYKDLLTLYGRNCKITAQYNMNYCATLVYMDNGVEVKTEIITPNVYHKLPTLPNKGDSIFIGWTKGGTLYTNEKYVNGSGRREFIATYKTLNEIFTYTVENNEINITGILTKVHDLVIPDTIDGKPVTKISCDRVVNGYKFTPNTIVIGRNVKSIHQKFLQSGEISNLVILSNIQLDSSYMSFSTFNKLTVLDTFDVNLFYEGSDKTITDVVYIKTTNGSIPTSLSAKDLNSFGLEGYADVNLTGVAKSINHLYLAEAVRTIKCDTPFEIKNIHVESLEAWLGMDIRGLLSTSKYNLYVNGELLTSVTIPASVRAIKANAFRGASIDYLETHDLLESIGDLAFKDTNLRMLVIGKMVKTIGTDVLDGCLGFKELVYTDCEEQFKLININPTNEVLINSRKAYTTSGTAHMDNDGGISYTLINNMYVYDLKIADYNLRYLDIANTFKAKGYKLMSLAPHAFEHALHLDFLVLPNTLENINGNVLRENINVIYQGTKEEFEAIKSLSSNVTFANITSIRYVDTKEYMYYEINDQYIAIDKYYGYEPEVDLKAKFTGKSVVAIMENAFYNKDLRKIVIPETVKIIDDGAFKNNYGLKDVVIPQEIEYIGMEAFLGTAIGCVAINGTSLKKIGLRAFYNIEELTTLVLPDTVEYIGDYAFYGIGIVEFKTPANLKYLGSYAFDRTNIKSFTIPKGIEVLESGSIYYEALEELTIHENLRNLGSGHETNTLVRLNTPSLKTLNQIWIMDHLFAGWPNVVVYVNDVAFTELTIDDATVEHEYKGYKNLKTVNVEVPYSFKSEGFFNTGVTRVNYKDMATFNASTFDGYRSNPAVNGAEVYINNEIYNNVVIEGTQTNISKGRYAGFKLASVTINEGVETIENGAFANVEIDSIVLPSTIIDIQNDAFRGSTIKTFTLPEGITEIKDGTFADCRNLKEFVFNSQVKIICDEAFINTGLRRLELPDSVTYMEYGAIDSATRVLKLGKGYTARNQYDSFYRPQFNVDEILVDPLNELFTSQDSAGNELNALFTKDLTTCYVAGYYAHIPAETTVIEARGNNKLAFYYGTEEQKNNLFSYNFTSNSIIKLVTEYKKCELVDNESVSYLRIGNDVENLYLKNVTGTILDYNKVLPADLNIRTISNKTLDEHRELVEVILPKGLRNIDYSFYYHESLKMIRFTNTEPLEKSIVMGNDDAAVDFVSNDIIFKNNLELKKYRSSDTFKLYINGEKANLLVVPKDVTQVPDLKIKFLDPEVVAVHKGVTEIYLAYYTQCIFEGTKEEFDKLTSNNITYYVLNADLTNPTVVKNETLSYVSMGNAIYALNLFKNIKFVDFTTLFDGKIVKSISYYYYPSKNISYIKFDASTLDLNGPVISDRMEGVPVKYFVGTEEQFKAAYPNEYVSSYNILGENGACEYVNNEVSEYIELSDSYAFYVIKKSENGYLNLREGKRMDNIVIQDPEFKAIVAPIESDYISVKNGTTENLNIVIITNGPRYHAHIHVSTTGFYTSHVEYVLGNPTYKEENGIKYLLFDDAVVILDGKGYSGSLDIISDKIKHVGFAREAFMNNTKLTGINITPTIDATGVRAFMGCTNLASVKVNNHYEYSMDAFKGVNNITELHAKAAELMNSKTFNLSKVKKLTLIDSLDHYVRIDSVEELTAISCAKLVSKNLVKATVDSGFVGDLLYMPNNIEELTINKTSDDYPYGRMFTNSLRVLRLRFVGDKAETLYLPMGDKLEVIESNNRFYFKDKDYLAKNPSLKYIFIGMEDKDAYVDYDDSTVRLVGMPYVSNEELENERFKYSIINGSYVVIHEFKDTTCEALDLNNEFDGKTIIEINNKAFMGKTALKSIALPDGLRTIGNSAFKGCTNLASVTFNDGIRFIERDAFTGCMALRSVNIHSDKLYINRSFRELDIEEITITGKDSFLRNSFAGCDKVRRIDWVGDGYDGIESCLLEYRRGKNKDFSNPKLNASLKEIEVVDYRFDAENFPNIRKASFVGTQTIAFNVFLDSYWLSEVVLPDTLNVIDSHAFANCRSLKSITLPEGLLEINSSAFLGCIGLKSIVIPSTVSIIEDYAFYDTRSLENVVIKEGVKEIHYCSFAKSGITSIEIPSTVTSISDGAFNAANNLRYITIPSGATFAGINNQNRDLVIIARSGSKFIGTSLDNILLAEDSKNVLSEAEFSARYEKYGYTVETIGMVFDGVFEYLLINNELAVNVSYKGTDGNADLSALDNYEVIGFKEGGFKNAVRVTLPTKLFNLNVEAFDLSKLRTVNIKSLESFMSIKEMSKSIFIGGATLELNNKVVNELILPELNMNLELPYFNDLQSVRILRVPGSYKRITDGLDDLDYLEELYLEEGVEYVSKHLFEYNKLVKMVSYPSTLDTTNFKVQGYNLCIKHPSVEHIKNIGYADYHIIPKAVKAMDYNKFDTIIYEGTNEEFAKLNLTAKPRLLFTNTKAESIRKVSTRAYTYLLVDNKYVYDIKLNNGYGGKIDLEHDLPGLEVKHIASNGFYGVKVDDFRIPSTVVEIGSYAFGAALIKNLYIPASVTKVDNCLFQFETFENIIIDKANPVLTSGDNNNMIYDKANKALILAGSEAEIPDGCEALRANSLKNGSKVFVPKSVKVIENSAINAFILYEGTEEEWNAIQKDYLSDYGIAYNQKRSVNE